MLDCASKAVFFAVRTWPKKALHSHSSSQEARFSKETLQETRDLCKLQVSPASGMLHTDPGSTIFSASNRVLKLHGIIHIDHLRKGEAVSSLVVSPSQTSVISESYCIYATAVNRPTMPPVANNKARTVLSLPNLVNSSCVFWSSASDISLSVWP